MGKPRLPFDKKVDARFPGCQDDLSSMSAATWRWVTNHRCERAPASRVIFSRWRDNVPMISRSRSSMLASCRQAAPTADAMPLTFSPRPQAMTATLGFMDRSSSSLVRRRQLLLLLFRPCCIDRWSQANHAGKTPIRTMPNWRQWICGHIADRGGIWRGALGRKNWCKSLIIHGERGGTRTSTP